MEYLKEKDFWKNINIRDKQFNEELENIKLLNIKISKILWLYYYLSDNKVEEFDKDAEEEYAKRKNKTKKSKMIPTMMSLKKNPRENQRMNQIVK